MWHPHKIFDQKQQGQTLIEVLIALTIGVVVIGALSIATVVSLRNSQFSQNQAQATKLAQEGVELVRAVRDRDGVVDSVNPNFAKFSDVWAYNFGTLGTAGFLGYLRIIPATPGLVRFDVESLAYENISEIFNRVVIVEDAPDDAALSKKVTVKVMWTDATGSHESNLQTLLTKH